MADWSAGYVTELDYIQGYYRELSPALLRLAILNRGIGVRHGRPFRYLELGYGLGLSVNIHAAACPGEFWGTDFNPGHAASAMEMAEAAGSGARIFDRSFAELAARDDLPEFDVIALHGIWSWVSDENRAVIVDLVRRKLAVGGMLYISYNCTPGWSPAMPLRHLLTLHAELAGSDGKGIAGRIDSALGFAQRVVDSGAAYFRANPAVAERIKTMGGQSRSYLAHEFFNRDWEPMAFSQVVKLLSDAKVDYAASAKLFDHYDGICLTADGRKLMAEIAHPVLRESMRDYMIGAQFRQDIFVKGGRTMSPLERHEHFLAQGFVLLDAPADIPLKIQVPLGEAVLNPELYTPVIEALAANGYAAKTLAELAAHPALAKRPPTELIEALAMLVGANRAHPAQDAAAIKLAAPRCAALNAYLCGRARADGDIAWLASPVIGGGVVVGRIQQLFLSALRQGRQQPHEWAKFAWDLLFAQGQRVLKDGKALEVVEDNIAELTTQATDFAEKRLPILKALGVA